MEDCGTELMPNSIHNLMEELTPECFINTILQIAHDVLSAIICLNKKELSHCDIKVENVVIYEQKTPETPPAAPSPPPSDLLTVFSTSAAADAVPSPPQQVTKPCPMIKAKLIDMDNIGYIDAKRCTSEDTPTFEAFFNIKNVMFNIPVAWIRDTSLTVSYPKFHSNLKTQKWGDSKGYIDIFSWCVVCLHLLLNMCKMHFNNMEDKKGRKNVTFKNSGPNETLSQNLAFVKAYMLESLISDMCLPDIKIDDRPIDKSLTGRVIDVEYCKNVASFLLWLKNAENVDGLSFPVKKRQKWWKKKKPELINLRIPIVLAGEELGGGYNKSNRGRDIRKNKHCLSKRIKKRKYKRTHKRKYKRTHKRKYKKTNKTIKL